MRQAVGRLKTKRLTREIFLRILADAVLINLAILAAMAIRLLYLIAYQLPPTGNARELFWSYLISYRNAGWLLILICLVVFGLSGFYTRGRAYRGRYKAIIIVQGVSTAYLIYGFLSYFVGEPLHLPRSMWVLAWILTLLVTLVSRLWATLWTGVVRVEQRLAPPEPNRRVDNVLVIGGAGYIGSALLPRLLEKGYNVRLLDLLLYGTEPIADFIDHPRLEIVKADFRQVDVVVEAMRDIDAVIHLGAIVGDPACALDEELTIEVNLMATRMIAEVAKGSNVSRFVFASTCSVYGAGDEILSERSALNPISLYAKSKIASEKVLRRMSTTEFAPTMLRFGTIYGLSGRTRFDLVVNLLTAKALVEGEITMYGGDQWRPFVHVDDAALAVFRVLEARRSQVRDQVFNVGSNDQNRTIRQIGKLIQEAVPTAELLNMGSDTDLRNYRVNFDKIHRELGFRPEWTLEEGIGQVVRAVESGEVVDYRASEYSNVRFLSEESSSRLMVSQNGWARELLNETYEADLRPATAGAH